MLPQSHRLDERNHVEKPFLDQLAGLGWEILDLDKEQVPSDSHREKFTEVVMLPVLHERLRVINPWLENDQVDEVVKRLTASFPGTGLLENNRHVFNLLLENTSVGRNRQTGENSPTVRFIDFDDRGNNRFMAICQFRVQVPGTGGHIIPDIVLFLNGLPVVVIECKSPRVKDAIPEAIDQLLRYSQQREARGEGNPSLFYYNQFVVATCRQQAKFGTITTHGEKYFYRWADPYPRTVDDLEHGAGGPNDQQRLVAGMLDRGNLLDLIRTFTLFTVNEEGKNPQDGGALPAVPGREAGGEASAGRPESGPTQRHRVAHPGFGQVPDHDVHGPRDVPPRGARPLEGGIRHRPHPARTAAFRDQPQHWLYGESGRQHPEAQGAAAGRHLGSGHGHDPQVSRRGPPGDLSRTQPQPPYSGHDPTRPIVPSTDCWAPTSTGRSPMPPRSVIPALPSRRPKGCSATISTSTPCASPSRTA